MPRCIYCLEEKSAEEFNREHVFPEAFGLFANNLRRLRCVCLACNQRFGDSVELGLARDSFEALLRFRYGLKDPSKVGELGSRRLSFTYAGSGPWEGVLLRLVLEGSNLVVDLIPQVAFQVKASGAWKHFSEADLEREALDDSDLDLRNVKLFAPSVDVEARLFSKLAERGVTFEKRERLDPPGLFAGGLGEVDIHFQIDRGVRRCVAKIALNYLAFVGGHDFALKSDFHAVRRFVLDAESPGHPVVSRLHIWRPCSSP